MRRPRHETRSIPRQAGLGALILGVLGIGLLGIAGGACAADVVVPGTTDFPESVTASSDGTLFFSSLAGGRIFKAAPGETQAKEWIKPGTNGLSSAVGVLADDRSNTLFVCSTDMTWAGIHVPAGNTPTALKMFDLKTGAPKGSLALPASTLPGQSALCNDIAVAADGTAYVTDTLSGHILRLRPGATSLDLGA